MNPSRPNISDDDLQLRLGAFSRTASGGSFVLSGVPSGVQPDIHKPEKISDFEARLEQFRTVLSWTATGDDLDQGQGTVPGVRPRITHMRSLTLLLAHIYCTCRVMQLRISAVCGIVDMC